MSCSLNENMKIRFVEKYLTSVPLICGAFKNLWKSVQIPRWFPRIFASLLVAKVHQWQTHTYHWWYSITSLGTRLAKNAKWKFYCVDILFKCRNDFEQTTLTCNHFTNSTVITHGRAHRLDKCLFSWQGLNIHSTLHSHGVRSYMPKS